MTTTDKPCTRFTLEPRRWYACELIGDEFGEDKCSYSPIKAYGFEPVGDGSRTLILSFYHANYPAGVRDKTYRLQTIERGSTFLLVRSLDHQPARILRIYDIDATWMGRHFPSMKPARGDVQAWLETNL